MSDVPPEIWLYIASFICDDDLKGLMGVNIHFYNLGMALRYGTIHIDTVNSRTDRLLRRLRDPVVASRVRRLVIQPTKSKMPVVSWDKSLDNELKNFFAKAWSSVGPQLETISIAGRPESIRQFIGPNPQATSCTALTLQFTHELDPMAVSAAAGTLVDSVASFVNSLAPRLQTLKIRSWSTLDLSDFFFKLGVFPQMRHFRLHTPFNTAFSNAKGLTKLLQDNASSLDIVSLLLNPAGAGTDRTCEHVLAEWLLSHASNEAVLANLKTLRLYPTALPSGFDALVTYVNRSADTLTTLVVKDRYFTLEEVAALISPVAHRSAEDGLQTLEINVRTWNAELFNLLSLKLPGLKSLSLVIGGSHATNSFLDTMQPIESWKLRDIGVWQSGSEVSSSTMRLLAKGLPFVQSFWGNGHMLGEREIFEDTVFV
ncbi:hypothetical protein FB45DRAFT_893548 [Roridomyces roridus]|uniref:F-box domain-containing protein n=1 Tax=Roridomyces roridus TaxID=1738132 RepID=A0AAD7CHN4_9AGAR|nr:hypothetical protein FB45DRAFT_893548 [Roridomyces roridus]